LTQFFVIPLRFGYAAQPGRSKVEGPGRKASAAWSLELAGPLNFPIRGLIFVTWVGEGDF
jgi:hypothetical protein